eukprot:CAMPEP_0175255774 /NCGR_PEP_ID=MMETSP0093-20121207/37870_1 /TAXON_ID=311494 /ORGANISM="Alexandrium monilatum, Strain CCMP3105" /LENGTH=45 /DNA_ID= /DNA_START= /DNA_END= /DNA_ORIENTATION=
MSVGGGAGAANPGASGSACDGPAACIIGRAGGPAAAPKAAAAGCG